MRRLVSGIGVAALLLGACFAAPAAQAQKLITIGGFFPPTFETTYQKFLIDGGFLGKYGYRGKFVGFSAGATTVQAAASGSVDVGCESPATPIAAMEQGGAFRVVEMIDAETTMVIATRAPFQKPGDLKGKNWGITMPGSITQTYAQLYIEHFGMHPDDVNWVALGGGPARSLALAAGQVDASLLPLSDWMKVASQPGVKLLGKLSDGVPPLPFSSCFVPPKTIEKRPEMVQAFVNAAMDAARFAYTPQGKAAYIRSFAENSSSFTPKELESLYDFYFVQNRFSVDPNGGMYPEALHNNMQLMVNAGTIKAVRPLEQVWDNRFVNNYIATNGWFDYQTKTSGKTFPEITKR